MKQLANLCIYFQITIDAIIMAMLTTTKIGTITAAVGKLSEDDTKTI